MQNWKLNKFFRAFFVLFILTTGIVFRFLDLETVPGINGDEAWIGWKANRFISGENLDFRSNSGIISNPFFLLSSIVFHYFIPAGGLALRIGAAVAGVLTIIINYWFTRKAINKTFALSSSLLLAVLPIAILHSRFGWEPTHIPLFAVIFLGCALMVIKERMRIFRWAGLGAGIFLLSTLVHPTVIFLAPFLPISLLAIWLKPENNWKKFCIFFIASAGVIFFFGLVGYWMAPPWVRNEIAARVGSLCYLLDDWPFVITWIRVFNGLNSFCYLAGTWPMAVQVLTNPKSFQVVAWDWWTLGLFVIAVFVVFVSAQKLRKSKEDSTLLHAGFVLSIGFTLTSIWFWVVNGSGKAAVWFDRYSLWAIVPGVWFISWAFMVIRSKLLTFLGKRYNLSSYNWILDFIALAICLCLLINVWSSYFSVFYRCGGEGSMSTRTAVEYEPKLAAADELLERLQMISKKERPLLLSGDWFAFWPVIYRLEGRTRDRVDTHRMLNKPDGTPILPENFSEEVSNRLVIVMDFFGGRPWETWNRVFKSAELVEELIFHDRAGREVLILKIYRTGLIEY